MPLSARNWVKLKDEAERVAMEIAEYNNKLNRPLNAYFRACVVAYYRDGRIYDSEHHSTPVDEMPRLLANAERYGWAIDYDPETKVFKFEKHFPNGMYRIATYTPFDKDAIEVNVTP